MKVIFTSAIMLPVRPQSFGRRLRRALLIACVVQAIACGTTDAPIEKPPVVVDPVAAEATRLRIAAALAPDLDALVQAATELHDAAPLPVGRGWDATLDAAAIDAMKRAWIRGHDAYERVEVAIEPLFPDLHGAVDGRYEEAMTSGERERDPFDTRIVTGFHAVERILWSDAVPEAVMEFEHNLPLGFDPRYPATAEQARDFKNKLVNGILGTATVLRDRLAAKIDVGRVLGGVVALLAEQKADLNRAAFGQDESRYARRSMTDLRSGLAGARVVFEAYRPWLAATPDGVEAARKIDAGFVTLAAAYDAIEGEATPDAPPRWKPLHPADDALATPFGRVFSAIAAASETGNPTSLAFALDRAAITLGLPPYPEDP
jgi:iron uptake system component EfeO